MKYARSSRNERDARRSGLRPRRRMNGSAGGPSGSRSPYFCSLSYWPCAWFRSRWSGPRSYRRSHASSTKHRIVLPAARGAITDRNGKVLVSNSTFVTFGADPKVAGNERDDIAAALSRVFHRPRECLS